MNFRRKFKKIVAVLLVAAQVTMLFSGCGKGGGSIFDIFKTSFKVTFALPENATDFEVSETKLPEALKVKKGTLIGALPESSRTSSVFMGYSYDPEGLNKADENTAVKKDLTLYPVFETAEGMTNVFDMNFVSGTDVKSDYAIVLSAYGLSQKEVTELIRIKDLSNGDENVPFVIEQDDNTVPGGLNIPEKVLPYVKNLINANRTDPKTDLMTGLYSMGLDSDSVYKLILIYAPEERDAFFDDYAVKTGDAGAAATLKAQAAGIGTRTENELKELYGLSEKDSLERYWREDMGYDIENVLKLSDIVKANSVFSETVRFTIYPSEEGWTEGDLFQVEILNTERLRFVFGDQICTEYITYYNFTVGCEEVKNMAVDDGVLFIPLSEVKGVTLGSMFEITVDKDGNQKAAEKERKGTLTYSGDRTLSKGLVIAVYDGTLNEDKSVDGEVGYFEITEVKGNGQYSYQGADFRDVIALPEIIPVKFATVGEDSTAFIPASDLKFDKRIAEVLGFEGDAVIDKGDYLAFYNGTFNLDNGLDSSEGIEFKGYAKVNSVTEEKGGFKVSFTEAPAEEVLSSVNMHMDTGTVAPEITKVDREAVKQAMLDEIEKSNLVEEASDYLCDALLSDEADLAKYQNRDKLAEMKFKDANGGELTFDEVRKLAGGGEKVKVDDVNVSFILTGALQHFEGEAGLRAEVTVSLKITISLGEAGNIEITPMAIFEQEVLISPTISVKAKWGYLLGFIPYLAYVDIDPSFKCGTYTGIGLTVTIMTKSNENDSEFSEMAKEYEEGTGGKNEEERKKYLNGLVKSGETLKGLADMREGGAGGEWSGGKKDDKKKDDKKDDKDDDKPGLMESKSPGVGGDLPTKYSNMLGNDAEYIDLVEQEIGTFATPVDPFHIVEFSIGAYLVVSFKLNAMIGTGVSYENAKMFTYHVRKYVCVRGEDEKYSEQADLATPHFRADFYAFGMIGIRAGIRIDVRLGIISTKLASIGVTAEVGLYAEVYGFLYVWYEWTSGQGSTSGAMGSLYFEVGIYVEVNFKAQLGDGQLEKEISLYENTWPLLKLGAEFVPLDFTIEKNSDDLDLKYEEGQNWVALPADLYKINMMEMKSGEVSEEDMDDTASVGEGKSFTMRGRTYTQYDEEHFTIECYDTDKDGKKLDTCSFIYLPATNEVLVKPANTLVNEVWGEVKFTYKNNTFGFNTSKIQRIVKLHWQGTPASATVEYYIEKEPGSGEYELKEEGEFDGFNGIEYDLIVDDKFTNKYEGYRLKWVEFADTAQFKERYYNLLESYNQLAGGNNPSPEMLQQIAEQRAKLDAAFENYNNYGQNIVDTVEKGKGTLYFLMGETDTVVKVYFDHIVNDVEWRVWGDPSMDGDMGTMLGHGKIENVAEGTVIADKLTEADEIIKKYEKALTLERREFAINEEGAEFTEFKNDTLMGKESVVVDYYVKGKTYKLTWKLDGETVKTDEIGAFYRTSLKIPETQTVAEGYSILYWDASDMNKDSGAAYYISDIVTENARYVMPARDAVINAKLKPNMYTIEWYADDRLLARDSYAEYGSVISQSPWFPRSMNDHQINHWFLVTSEGRVALEDSMTVPAGDVRLQVEYEFIPYTATFMDGNTVVATVDEDENRQVTVPEYRDRTRENQGYELTWLFHAPEYSGMSDTEYKPGDKAYMPYSDATFTAEWKCARHRWNDGVITTDASCTVEGVRTFTCLNCGEKKTEQIATTGHNWNGGTVTRQRDCGHDEEITYRCDNCGATRTESGAPATGQHTFGTATYTWSNDREVCQGSKTCSVCGRTVTETATVTSAVTTQPSGSTPGVKTFTATFTAANGFTTQTNTLEFLADTNVYCISVLGGGFSDMAAIQGNTISILIPNTDYDDTSIGLWVDDIISELKVMYEGNYVGAYVYDGPNPSDETAPGNPFAGITVAQAVGQTISISFTVSGTFAGNISNYAAAPTQITFHR